MIGKGRNWSRLRGLFRVVRDSDLPGRLVGRVGIDTRSLAGFRLLVGAILIVDILLRARKFDFFYTDAGAVPIDLAASVSPGTFSLYFLSGHPAWTATLFCLQAVVGFVLIVGWRTRTAAVLAFLLTVSLDHRNMLVTSYADTLLRHLLFFSPFLPLSERWSVDALRRDREPRASVVSFPAALILLQMVFMYLATGLLKTESELWRTGAALPVIISHDKLTFLLGDIIQSLPVPLLEYGGVAWMWMLVGSPLLFLLAGRLRAAFTLGFIGVHATLGVSVRIGEFSPVAIAGLTLFLPAIFWADARRIAGVLGLPHDRWRRRLRRCGARLDRRLPDWSPTAGLRWRERLAAVPLSGRARTVGSVLVALCFLVWGADMVIGVAEATGHVDTVDALRPIEDTKESFGVEQPTWDIFASAPSITDGWFVVAVETADGRRLNLHNERRLSFRRPGERLDRQWDTYRERFYWDAVARPAVGAAYRNYLCRGGNPQAGNVAHVTVYQATERINGSRPETFDDPGARSLNVGLLYSGTCGGRDHEIVRPRRGTDRLWR